LIGLYWLEARNAAVEAVREIVPTRDSDPSGTTVDGKSTGLFTGSGAVVG
jgi:hypothetical protein